MPLKSLSGMKALCVLLSMLCALSGVSRSAEPTLRSQALTTMRKAATFFRTKVASHGGYVYYYSLDLSRRLGEGKATAEQVWVQRPGTPAVGMSYLKAYAATRDSFYLDAARETAEALVYGQLASGGWTNSIDFDPNSLGVALYRNGKGRGRNYSSLDDGISQAALRFLMHADRALDFKHREINEAAKFARDALLAAQFPSGGFPQVWSGPVAKAQVVKARYPDYEWRTENRIKNYWDMPTLNDGLAGTMVVTLTDAWEIYKDERYLQALTELGDFLILAQMPAPQPAWAQQYDLQMRPIWARKFEPPAIAGHESQDAIEALMTIYRLTNNAKYLEPIPRALAYLKSCALPDGRLARYYELQTNKPLYMTPEYTLTYDDSAVPDHYGWKTSSRLESLERAFSGLNGGSKPTASKSANVTEQQVREILQSLDSEGRWVSTYAGQLLVGQPKFKKGETFIASEVFSANLEALSAYVTGGKVDGTVHQVSSSSAAAR